MGQGKMECESVTRPHYDFEGMLQDRLTANEQDWLLRAPHDNPGLLDMFRVRDIAPAPDLVPWAGEFVVKYLLSAIQAMRLSNNPALKAQTRRIVADLISTQAEDGYLGPFPLATRLKANWDLWGHYHCMLALLMWNEDTGDTAALASARKIADLICRTFLNTGLRVRDAGSPEMNMAVIHGLGVLYRRTREPRYLAMMHEIEKDWESAGDYVRQGVAGVPFFQTPRPRWESLHDLQGLVELYRITGEEKYRLAFENHWRGILRWDRHNTGAFSTGEGAIGDPYASGPIETCCTVAWMAVTLDMLRLTGDARAADELELTTWNACLGAQHPSGRWWTYDTPMDGVRIPSYTSIAFQARPTTPELNCCSVNGPRGLGMLSEWSVMTSADTLIVNYYGPGHFQGRLPDKTPVGLRWITRYPLSGHVRLKVETERPHRFALKLRIPGWSRDTRISVNGIPETRGVAAGRYLTLQRDWKPGDTVTLDFDMRLRVLPGDQEATGKVSLYRGPLLLAYDMRDNGGHGEPVPLIRLDHLPKTVDATGLKIALDDHATPWLRVTVPGVDGHEIHLCDYAGAGDMGTSYASWLPAQDCPRPAAEARTPDDGSSAPPGKMLFQWTGEASSEGRSYRLLIARTPAFGRPVLEKRGIHANRLVLDAASTASLVANQWYYWKVVAMDGATARESAMPPARFRIDPQTPAHPESYFTPPPRGVGALIVEDALRGKPAPSLGSLQRAIGGAAAVDRAGIAESAMELNGSSDMLLYNAGAFPEQDYSVCIDACITRMPMGLGQVFSAWTASLDDPLRICVDNGKLFARMEAGAGYSTEGFSITPGAWVCIAVVKEGAKLTLYVDGKARGSVHVPARIQSRATDIALGGNPHYTGKEFLAVRLAGFRFYGRALSAQEVADFAARPEPK